MKNVTKFIVSVLLLALAATSSFAQATGQLQSGQVWGNSKASQAPASPNTIAQILARVGNLAFSSSSASALAVGLNGATNPAFQVDSSVGSQAAGLKITGAVTGGTVAVVAIDSGSNTNLTINAKGTGTIGIGSVSTGVVTITPNVTHSGTTTLSAALTYGGVTLSNSVVGTGSMVLSSGPSIATLTVTGAFNATGLVTFADMASAAIATTANYLAGAANVVVPASVIYTSETTTTFGATTTFDFNTFINTAVTLTGNITTQTLSNVTAGKGGSITFIQDGTGSRTTVWNTIFKFTGGTTPVLSIAPGAVDVLFYSCRSATNCPASLTKDVR